MREEDSQQAKGSKTLPACQGALPLAIFCPTIALLLLTRNVGRVLSAAFRLESLVE